MTPIDAQLLDFAEALGVRIDYRRLREDRDGQYIHTRKVIHLRPGMHARHHRSVLAHELGHAVFGDIPTKFGPVNAKQERRAEEWAALRLIDHTDYQHLEAAYDGRPAGIALELGVMTSIVTAYQARLQRIGDVTYIGARMGAGQWAHRVEVA
ncbi:ImmA/IrrE family metallo-endopeptidase [Microbacterium sp. A94]|uniref:ImmA/IrrE family metallo-endopeptidase n=1 Tax=Microbacterium sp. A94 TaxID=3450717 RepID=UPI003F43D124